MRTFMILPERLNDFQMRYKPEGFRAKINLKADGLENLTELGNWSILLFGKKHSP